MILQVEESDEFDQNLIHTVIIEDDDGKIPIVSYNYRVCRNNAWYSV